MVQILLKLVNDFTHYLPVLVIWDGGQGRVETVHMEGLVTLITQQLLVWILLHPTHMAVTHAAVLLRVILADLTLWAI